MSNVVTTISISPKVRKRGHKAAKKLFGTEKKFSLYVQGLIEADCDQKGIK